MLTLSISHNIFLTPEEITQLIGGQPVETSGTSVPVWFYKGNTSEPAKEIFCHYKLTNVAEDYPISILAKGYQINMPQPMSSKRPDDWGKMTNIDKAIWRANNSTCLGAKDLLDLGTDDTLHFKRYNKITENERRMNIIHCVEIGTQDILLKSIDI